VVGNLLPKIKHYCLFLFVEFSFETSICQNHGKLAEGSEESFGNNKKTRKMKLEHIRLGVVFILVFHVTFLSEATHIHTPAC
jgi:hypothetical protein